MTAPLYGTNLLRAVRRESGIGAAAVLLNKGRLLRSTRRAAQPIWSTIFWIGGTPTLQSVFSVAVGRISGASSATVAEDALRAFPPHALVIGRNEEKGTHLGTPGVDCYPCPITSI